MPYGDPKVMLKRKFSYLLKTGPLWKMKGDQLAEGFMKIINLIMDLMKLAKTHNIENKVYYGEGLDMIYGLLGDNLITKWLDSKLAEKLEGKQLWMRLVKFLEKELNLLQEKL